MVVVRMSWPLAEACCLGSSTRVGVWELEKLNVVVLPVSFSVWALRLIVCKCCTRDLVGVEAP